MSVNRVFLIVLDSLGIGALPDAAAYGDEGSNTFLRISKSPRFCADNLYSLGFGQIEGVEAPPSGPLAAAVARMSEQSAGKDTTTGHWEMAGLISRRPFPVFPNGFPPAVIKRFEEETGRGTLCNRPYSGTEVIKDYGEEHLKTGKLIVYTSADSVFQVAAHEDVVPVAELYRFSEIARGILTGEYGVGRVIARPFTGAPGAFVRTPRRHDYSLAPPRPTLLDELEKAGLSVIGIGKIHDIFTGRGLSRTIRTSGNVEGMEVTGQIQKETFRGLCFVNLVDFDMLYGHRNDVDGYAASLAEFDQWLGGFLRGMKADDVLIITGDHGCDPGTASTDHSREYVPMLAAGEAIRPVNLGSRDSFADIAATIADWFGLKTDLDGVSFAPKITRGEK